MTMRRLLPCLLLATTPLTAEPRLPVVADFDRLEELSQPALSPDGRFVAYTVRRTNTAEDLRQSDLFLASIDGKERLQLTFTPKDSESSPRFSPDGKTLAFLSAREGEHGAQVWVLPRGGGEATRLTDFKGGVSDYVWAPDGRHLAVIAHDPDPDVDVPEKDRKPKPLVINRTQFKEDGTGFLTRQRQHLYTFNLVTHEAVLLTPGDHDESLPAWSPNGKTIAYVTKRGPDPDRHFDFDIYLVAPDEPGKERCLTRFPGADPDPSWGARPAWSPDAQHIAYLQGREDRWIYYAPPELAVVEVESGAARLIAPRDRAFGLPQWSADGRSIYALLEESRTSHLVRIDPATGALSRLTEGPRWVSDFEAGGESLVLLASDDHHPESLCVTGLDGKGEHPLLRHNEWLDEVRLSEVRPISFTSRDGTEIDGLLTLPAGYEAGKRYPTLLRIHGGPVAQYDHELMLDWQVFAARGYAVVAANPRGSSGRGFDFARAIYADWGGVDTADVLAAVDHAVALGVADPKRLGLGGWSYGGILTDFVIAKDSRFKAAVSGAGSANALATWGTDQYIREYTFELGTPWANLDAFLRVSYPLLHADHIKTPTLFLCGALDVNVPVIGSEQLYQALRLSEVPTELVLYPDQYHSISRPSFIRDRVERSLAWYDRYLKTP